MDVNVKTESTQLFYNEAVTRTTFRCMGLVTLLSFSLFIS